MSLVSLKYKSLNFTYLGDYYFICCEILPLPI